MKLGYFPYSRKIVMPEQPQNKIKQEDVPLRLLLL